MPNVEFERAVLRELDQIHLAISAGQRQTADLIAEASADARRAVCAVDEEVSELKLKISFLEAARAADEKARAEAKPERNWIRDGGLVLTPSLLIPLAQALIAALQTPAPPTAPVAHRTPAAVVAPAPSP
jgi:hypothetical protein